MNLHTTSSQTAGPYVHLGLTDKHAVAHLAGERTQGERIDVTLFVWDGDGAPVADAIIEVWQADSHGRYAHPEDPQHMTADPQFRSFGRVAVDDKGSCTFHTIKPGRVPGPNGVSQAPHISVSVFARGLLKRLATRIYFADDRNNGSDPVLALVPGNRRETLMAKEVPGLPGSWRFDIRLCCDNETVFFDV
jgi:protocatechuate 3,4-dioxygenase, alpha subunit